MLAIQIAIVAGLILLNGLLAMSELAVVSSRPSRLAAKQKEGKRGAARALALAADPGRFLSTVQIGITLVGVLSGAFSGSTLGLRLAEWLATMGLSPTMANTVGVGGVVAIITYFSLVVGELVPKQIALRDPERIAMMVAPLMTVLATLAAPLVWLLNISGRLFLILLGQSGQQDSRVTDEEINSLIAEAETQGTIETDERRMITGVMRLGDRAVRALMTPRSEVEWLNLDADRKDIRRKLIETKHSRLPAASGAVDHAVGVVHTRELLAALLSRKPFDAKSFVRAAPIVHDNADALDVLATLREAEVPMALVHDEYGAFEGLVTPADVLETIAGAFKADLDAEGPPVVKRADGSWLIAGHMPADEMAETLGFVLPVRRDYDTVAGFLLSFLHHLPTSGETVDAHGWRFEVVDMDGRRIDKLIASRLPATHREKPV
ncbi:MAG: HlyC/CorC family transporter [Rhizobiaceae bacterium]|nr:HlyC/CorC family transporter [Rhizobiaceae bacterium]